MFLSFLRRLRRLNLPFKPENILKLVGNRTWYCLFFLLTALIINGFDETYCNIFLNTTHSPKIWLKITVTLSPLSLGCTLWTKDSELRMCCVRPRKQMFLGSVRTGDWELSDYLCHPGTKEGDQNMSYSRTWALCLSTSIFMGVISHHCLVVWAWYNMPLLKSAKILSKHSLIIP